MWLVAIAFLIWSYMYNTLSVGMVFWTILVVVLINGTISAFKTKTITVMSDVDTVKKLEAKIVALERRNATLTEQNGFLQIRAQAAIAAAHALGYQQPTPQFTPDAIKTLRNTLMKHHEQRRLDATYQGSKIASDTNAIIVQLNGYIAREKK